MLFPPDSGIFFYLDFFPFPFFPLSYSFFYGFLVCLFSSSSSSFFFTSFQISANARISLSTRLCGWKKTKTPEKLSKQLQRSWWQGQKRYDSVIWSTMIYMIYHARLKKSKYCKKERLCRASLISFSFHNHYVMLSFKFSFITYNVRTTRACQ